MLKSSLQYRKSVSPAEAVATAGVPVGYGLGSIAGFNARWLIEFVFRRMDVRNARFTAKEQALETRYDQRSAISRKSSQGRRRP
jgi:hypothetical protein